MKREDRIAIWLPNCPQWVELALAAKRVGAMVIAINTRFRAREVQDILTRSEATHLAYWPGFHGIDFDAILADVARWPARSPRSVPTCCSMCSTRPAPRN